MHLIGRKLLALLGVALLVAAALLPVDWYTALPFRADLATPPVSGVTLLRLALALGAVVLLAVAASGSWFTRRADALMRGRTLPDDALDSRSAASLLAAITLLALVLRLYRVSSDLWLDEIAALRGFGQGSVIEILSVFSRSGNHLLNTLLVKFTVSLFGETEWAVRLPAVLFGVATVPALYWVARLALSRWASLATALLLAVSYHHIFFSQNARGYSAYLFFSVLSTGFFVRALDDDRSRTWSLFVASAVLNLASQLLSAFVITGHFLTGAAVAAVSQRRTATGWAAARRLLAVFSVIGLLGFTLYSLILSQAYAGFTAPYKTLTSGYAPAGREFFTDVLRGVVEGFGPTLLLGALPFLAIAALGFAVLVRTRWVLAAALASPLALTFALFIARHMTLRPRFFLLAVPVAMLCFVQGLWTLVDAAASRAAVLTRSSGRLKTACIAALTIVSLVSLVAYYRVPKQPYRATIEFLRTIRQPGNTVILFGNAEQGFRFYGARAGWGADPDFVYLRDPALVDSLIAAHEGATVYLVFTLSRDIRLSQPEFAERLQREWIRVRVFSATVGDGAITILRHKAPVRTSAIAVPPSVNALRTRYK